MTVSRWRWLTTSIQSRHSRRQLPIQRSACALALGAISGVRITQARLRLEDPIGLGCKLLVPIVDQHAEIDPLILESPTEIASLLGKPGGIRFRGAARQQDSTRRQMHI